MNKYIWIILLAFIFTCIWAMTIFTGYLFYYTSDPWIAVATVMCIWVGVGCARDIPDLIRLWKSGYFD